MTCVLDDHGARWEVRRARDHAHFLGMSLRLLGMSGRQLETLNSIMAGFVAGMPIDDAQCWANAGQYSMTEAIHCGWACADEQIRSGDDNGG